MICPCKKIDCPRYGRCRECKDYHHSRGEKTACEKTNLNMPKKEA